MTQDITYKHIVIPSSLHPDTLLAIFLLKKFGVQKYPGIQDATIEIQQALPSGETIDSLHKKGMLALDIGGGPLDHHKKDNILSELVAQDLGIQGDPALAKLLFYAKRDDQHGVGTISTDQIDRTFGLSGIISAVNKTANNLEEVLQAIFPIFQAHYLEEQKRTKELPLEFQKNMENGKAEILEEKHKGNKIKIIVLQSDNVSMAGWLKSSIGMKADVVCLRKDSGYTNILTKQSKRIDLRWLVAYLRDEEVKLSQGKKLPISYLMTPGKISEVPEWYYDRATNSILNGGINPKGILPTKIALPRIRDILTEALSRDIRAL